jgi:hypothetical protein
MQRKRTKWKPVGLALAVLMIVLVAVAVVLIPAVASGGSDEARQDELAQVRQVTAQFHRVEAAIEAGYELGYVNGAGNRIITGCIAHPTAGAMGYHYFNKELVDDLVVDVQKPEALVYAPGADGELKLVSVEYVVPGPNSNPPGVSEPPTVLGMQMHILVPAVGFYILHAWVWSHNPADTLADWNPEVRCP